jgi:hypothetical protein
VVCLKRRGAHEPKSRTFELNRFAGGHIDNRLRGWEGAGVVDFDADRIGTIELLPSASLATALDRLHAHVDFTDYIQWAGRSASAATSSTGRILT